MVPNGEPMPRPPANGGVATGFAPGWGMRGGAVWPPAQSAAFGREAPGAISVGLVLVALVLALASPVAVLFVAVLVMPLPAPLAAASPARLAASCNNMPITASATAATLPARQPRGTRRPPRIARKSRRP